jgi:hypothetical protein
MEVSGQNCTPAFTLRQRASSWIEDWVAQHWNRHGGKEKNPYPDFFMTDLKDFVPSNED